MIYPPRYCQQCGSRLQPKEFPGGQKERLANFRVRKFCDSECSKLHIREHNHERKTKAVHT